MSEEPIDSADSVQEVTHEAPGLEAQSHATDEPKGSCLGSITSTVIGFVLLGVIILTLYSRFTYVSIRFLDNSENLEVTVYEWWGLKEETFPLRLRDVDGTRRWMYGDVEGRLESINYDDRFTNPVTLKLPWNKERAEQIGKTETANDGPEALEITP